MTAPAYYANAPITEAIIDVRIAPRAELTMEMLAQANSSAEKDYPVTGGVFLAQGLMELTPGGKATASASQEQAGFKFTSQDEKYIWQSRRDGFTLSKLAPYENWDPFLEEARRLWGFYRSSVTPESVNRLAVRYINRIDIPAAVVDLKDYFRTFPEVSPELPQMLGGFFMQLFLPQEACKANAIINQTIIPPPHKGVISIVLDIDIYRENDIPREENVLWSIFEELHVFKNQVFEACITDKTRELFR